MSKLRVFRDPVHTSIEFDLDYRPERLVLDLLDTAAVQRLRHIRQLGLANYVYHGAEHSRFSHTLGVTHIAKRLYRAASGNVGYPRDGDEYAAVLAAAVLHDVGHMPFSHAMEKVLDVDHETFSVDIVRGGGQVTDILTAYAGQDFVDSVADHIANASDAKTVGIISSQLDADRMDYILRDGYHAGVPNARYDLDRIVYMTHLDDAGLLFDVRAQQAIEGYFTARYHLYLQLYFHRTVRSTETMMRAVMQRAKDLANNGQQLGDVTDAVKHLFHDAPVTATVMRVTDHEMWAAFHTWGSSAQDNILRDLSHRLITRNLLKVFEVPAEFPLEVIEELMPRLQEVADAAGYDPKYYVLLDPVGDSPYKMADPGKRVRPIRIKQGNGQIALLEARSPIAEALQNAKYRRHRICYPAQTRRDIEKILKEALHG